MDMDTVLWCIKASLNPRLCLALIPINAVINEYHVFLLRLISYIRAKHLIYKCFALLRIEEESKNNRNYSVGTMTISSRLLLNKTRLP